MSNLPVIPNESRPGLERAALALSFGATQAEAARVVNVSDRTIRRWLGNDDFQRLVMSYRARHVHELERQLAELQPEAVATLHELLDASNPPHVRLGAARTVLDFGQRAREEADLIRRIQDLEACALESEDR